MPDETTRVLHEFGQPVSVLFDGNPHEAYRHTRSGYVRFEPPPPERLWRYYNEEYARGSEDYYTVDRDYSSGFCAQLAEYIENLAESLGIALPLQVHELGCSFGGKVDALARRGHAASGSDINADAIAQGRERRGNTTIFHAAHLDFLRNSNERYDVIYGLHTLEHEPLMKQLLAACRDRLKPAGLLMFLVPNAMYVRAFLDGFVSHPWTDYPAHIHMLSAGYLIDLCQELGLEPLSVVSRTSFAHDPGLPVHFGATLANERIRQTWDFLFSHLGLGMELEFVLTVAGTAFARQHRERIAHAHARLAVARDFEVAVRGFLETIPY